MNIPTLSHGVATIEVDVVLIGLLLSIGLKGIDRERLVADSVLNELHSTRSG